MKLFKKALFTVFLLTTASVFAENQSIQSFSKAKKTLEKYVYPDNRITLYCGAEFDAKKNVIPPDGFTTDKYIKRSRKIEWEHVVPAENFGRTFNEWREGDTQCINNKGKLFKGRKCAEKVNIEYRYMQSDLFNLYPAIGAVNALRSNYNFTMLPSEKSDFGSCEMKIEDRKAEPPVRARGQIARTYLYMDEAYERYNMSKQQKQLMNAWDKLYPVDKWECRRARKITEIQESKNTIVQSRCEIKKLW